MGRVFRLFPPALRCRGPTPVTRPGLRTSADPAHRQWYSPYTKVYELCLLVPVLDTILVGRPQTGTNSPLAATCNVGNEASPPFWLPGVPLSLRPSPCGACTPTLLFSSPGPAFSCSAPYLVFSLNPALTLRSPPTQKVHAPMHSFKLHRSSA